MKGIKELREKIGLRQEDLARMVGVGRSTVAMWESGAIAPNAAKLPTLANILHCTIDELFSWDTGQGSA